MVAVEEYEGCLKRGESPTCEQRLLSTDTQLEEFFFLGLRQTEGINLAVARDRWGSERLRPWEERIESLEKDGWLARCNGHIRLADRALLVSNEIFQEFITT
jgi:oxygen-independent coproporphyrinogen III oxidase